MEGLYFNGSSAQFKTDLPIPVPEQGESLVRISLAAVCNTDREIIRGYRPDFKGVLGHEFVGTVESSDDPRLVGKRVVGEINQGCGHCIYCLSGREGHCESRKCIGISGRDGCFARYMTIGSRYLHVLADSLPDEQAVFAEPLAAALEIPEQVQIRPSDEICVIGDGRLSFLVAQVLALNGAQVTVLGRHPEKLELFRDFAKTATELHRRFETVVDASGSPSGFDSAMSLVRSKGTIVMKSTYAGNKELNMSAVVVNEISVVGSRCGPFAPALRLLEKGALELPEISLFGLSQWREAFDSREFKVGFDLR